MSNVKLLSAKMHNTCVTFGTFNGVHKGHSRVLQQTIETAEKLGLTSVLLLMPPQAGETMLTTAEEFLQYDILNDFDAVLCCPLDKYTMKAEEFIANVLVGQLGAKAIVAGQKVGFGQEHTGDAALLEKLSTANGFKTVLCSLETDEEGNTITSDAIAHLLAQGEMHEVKRLLARPYSLLGKVVHGKALGRTVGMPTANLEVAAGKVIPAHGVYATLTMVDGQVYQSLTNIGKRPSVDNQDHVTIETFLLDYSGDLYGKQIQVEMYHFIRGVIKFNSLEEVKQQVDLDIASVKKHLDMLMV